MKESVWMSVLPTNNSSMFLIVECLRESSETLGARRSDTGCDSDALRHRISSKSDENGPPSEVAIARFVQDFLSSATQPTDFLQASLVHATEEQQPGAPVCWVSKPAIVESFKTEGITLKAYCEMLDDMLRYDEWTSWSGERVRVDIKETEPGMEGRPSSVGAGDRRALLMVMLEEDHSTSMTVAGFPLHPSPPSSRSCEVLWRKVVMQVSKMHLVSGFAAQQWAMTQQARDDIARLGQEKLAEQEVLLLSAQKVLNAKKRKIRTLTSLLEQVPTQGVETGAVKGEDVRLHDAYPHSKDFLGGKRARSQSLSNHSSTSGSSGGDDSTSSRDRSTSGDKLTDFNGAIHPSPAVDYPFISSETPPPPSSLLVATDEDQKTVQTVEPHRKKRRKSNCEAAPKDSDQNWLEDLFQP